MHTYCKITVLLLLLWLLVFAHLAHWCSMQAFMEKVVEECATDTDYVWIHDYHLLVLPSLLRKRFNKIRLGVFLHCPFPSSEIFRTFPKREEILRSMLNADLIGRLGLGMVLPGRRALPRLQHLTTTCWIARHDCLVS